MPDGGIHTPLRDSLATIILFFQNGGLVRILRFLSALVIVTILVGLAISGPGVGAHVFFVVLLLVAALTGGIRFV